MLFQLHTHFKEGDVIVIQIAHFFNEVRSATDAPLCPVCASKCANEHVDAKIHQPKSMFGVFELMKKQVDF